MEVFIMIVVTLFAIGIILLIITLPVKLAADALGAKRTGVLWCLLALIGSSILHGLGLVVPVIGSIIAFLLSSLAFSIFLGTVFLKGIGIHILSIIFAALIGGCIFLVFGSSLTGLISQLGLGSIW